MTELYLVMIDSVKNVDLVSMYAEVSKRRLQLAYNQNMVYPEIGFC